MEPDKAKREKKMKLDEAKKKKIKNLKFLELISKTLISDAFLEQSGKTKAPVSPEKELAKVNWS